MKKPVLIPHPAYKPEWPGVFEAYSRAWVGKHYWRVKHTLGTETDALQECALVWAKCAGAYTGKVDNPAWFMGLYKSALARHWHTLSTKDSQSPERHAADHPLTTPEEREAMFGHSPDGPCGMLAAAIAGASQEVRDVLDLLATAPVEVLGIVFAGETDVDHTRRLRRWLGWPPGHGNVLAELRDILT
jgi:hypothetical protein